MNSILNTSYQALIHKLAKQIKGSKNNIFQPEFIVGANGITQNYIKEQLVDANGIAANLKFLNWAEFTQMVFKYLRPENFDAEYVSKTKATNLLFESLNQLNEKQFEKVTNYFENDSRKRFGLTQKVYTLFEYYLKFEPSLLRGWDQSQLKNKEDEHEKWQAALWKIYRENLNKGHLYDDYFVHQFIKNSLKSSDADTNELISKIPTVHFVRLENITQAQIELLQLVEDKIEVKLYALSIPTQDKGNLAQLWQGNQPILSQLFKNKTTILSEFGTTTLLQQVQSKLIGKNNSIKTDHSIKIDGHYTTYREVEGLFNHLINYFETNPEAKSRNMVVYCNDIKQYLPAIHYFFQHEKYKIPYRIFGDFTYEQNTSVHAVEAILNYDKETLAPEELMSLIQMPAIAQHFGFRSFDAIRHWITQANIRHGYEGNPRIELDLISWKKGLNRLMLGSLTGADAIENETHLLDIAEGAELNELIALTRFIQLLNEFHLNTKNDYTIEKWVSLTTDLLENCMDTTWDQHYPLFIQYIHQFDMTSEEFIPFSTWLLMVKTYFSEIPSIKKPGTNGIIFTELKNAQIIPAEVSAVLGLNYNSFPRQHQALGFDLLQNNEEIQYHRTKEWDKFNVLQVLLQTSKQVYLSYQSHDPKSNKSLPPSLVIEQIIDFTEDQLKVVHHPLHGFSSKYNQGNPDLYSYTQHQLTDKSVLDQLETLPEIQEEQPKEVIIDLNEFIRFFQDSFKHFYTKKLGIYEDKEITAIPHHEALDVNNLDYWTIRNQFIEQNVNPLQLIDQDSVDDVHILEIIQNLKIKGNLPLNNLGLYYAKKAIQDKEEILRTYFERTQNKKLFTKTIDSAFQIDGIRYRIKGAIQLFEEELIIPIHSSNYFKYKLNWIITSMLAKDVIKQSLIISKDYGEEVFNTTQHEDLIIELIQHFSKNDLNPFYINKNLVAINTEEELDRYISGDSFLSEYVDKAYKKMVKNQDQNSIQQFIKNQNLIHQLLTA